MATVSTAPHLANSALDLTALREHAREGLTEILDKAKGTKVLVLDKNIAGTMNLILELKLLQSHGVTKLHYLESPTLMTDADSIIYLVRPDTDLMKLISKQIHHHNNNGIVKEYFVFFVPRRTMLCERVLAKEGVYGDVTTGEYELDLVPFDEDLLSLEMPLSFRECFLDGDPSSLYYVAKAIMKLQSRFGLIPTIIGKGERSAQIFNLLRRQRLEFPKDAFNSLVPEIDSLILIDRNVDLVTPLMMQLTYEGLVDEIFGIRNGLIEVDAQLLATGKEPRPPAPGDTRKVPLNAADSVFSEIRDVNYKVLGPLLRNIAAEIQKTYQKKDTADTVSKMKEFVTEFKTAHQEHTYLQHHIAIAEEISKVTYRSPKFDKRIDAELSMALCARGADHQGLAYIDSLIACKAPFLTVLRLLCLLSITQGVPKKKYDELRKDIVNTYGYERLFTLQNLEQLGMFRRAQGKSSWNAIRRSLGLGDIQAELDLKNPKDMNYLFNGYCPLSARLVEIACSKGWGPVDEVLRLLPGPHFQQKQDLPTPIQERMKLMDKGPSTKKLLTLVVFVGGVTFSEVSALRFLAQNEKLNRDFVVASTKLINGDGFLETLVENIENNLDRTSL